MVEEADEVQHRSVLVQVLLDDTCCGESISDTSALTGPKMSDTSPSYLLPIPMMVCASDVAAPATLLKSALRKRASWLYLQLAVTISPITIMPDLMVMVRLIMLI